MAWRRIADPSLTEIRNHIKESDEELRRFLAMMSERLRFQPSAIGDVCDSLVQPKFRLLVA